jgi:hypothetical protein
MNPQGTHCQGSRYLRLFWETTASKLPGLPALDIEHTMVTTECVTYENRRIDFGDGVIFVPVEVKLWAPDQPNQSADYFAFAKTKNKAARSPLLSLTVDGHEPSDSSKAGMGKDDYVCLSFKDDILSWLEACERGNTPETTIPVRENLRQRIAAVKSLCGKSEDAETEYTIFKLVIQSGDTGRAALAIRNAANFDRKAREAFKGPLIELVIKAWPAEAGTLRKKAGATRGFRLKTETTGSKSTICGTKSVSRQRQTPMMFHRRKRRPSTKK